MARQSKTFEALGAIELLEQDHQKVKGLFDAFESAEDTGAKRRIVETCLIELTIHAKLEEELFYPAARKHSEAELVDEAQEEHHVAKLLVSELSAMKPSDDRYDAKFLVLAESVRHHIEEEEGELFPQFRKSGIDLESLGQEMGERKRALMEEVSLETIREEMPREASKEMPRAMSSSRSAGGGRGRSRRMAGSRSKARA